MKNNYSVLFRLSAMVLCLLSFVGILCACNPSDVPETPSDDKTKVDVAIFMGQSNMAGRGEAEDSIVCSEGHGYEFRAVADPSKLYPLEEPFGATENNDALADLHSATGDGKKSGDMVAAFCEGYYEQTQTPLVCVSASVGGTSVLRWMPDREGETFFAESKRRLAACVDYLLANDYEIGNVFMVWCQGESDTTNWKNGKGTYDYFGNLKQVVDGMQQSDNGYGITKCFIVTPSEYSNGVLHDVKHDLVNHIIEWTLADDDFVLASKKFRNVPSEMRADPHFHQGIYNVCGYDAGVNTAYYFKTGLQAECTEFIIGEDVTLAEKFGVSPQYTSK